MTPAEWLRATLQERAGWWALPPEQFRIALWLVAVAQPGDGGSPTVTSTADDLARHFRVSRQKITRTIDALEKSGFCRVWTRRGRRGTTQIVILDVRAFSGIKTPDLLQAGTSNETCESRAPDDGPDRALSGHLDKMSGQGPETKCPDINSDIFQVAETTDPSDQDLQKSLLPDPDLISDLRSPTSGNNTLSGLEVPVIWADGKPAHEPGEPTPRVKVNAIADRAFAAADYLRGAILKQKPSALIGTVQWDPAVKAGRRLTWADSFRLLHAALLTAMRNEEPTTTEDKAWNEIARTVHWLFTSQPAGYGFVVESPDSLREKWDRIQDARRREAAPKPRFDGRPEPPPRQFRRLSDQ